MVIKRSPKLMISINNNQFKNGPVFIDFNKTLVSIRTQIQGFSKSVSVHQNVDGFFYLILQLSHCFKDSLTKPTSLRSTGVLLFNDRILINPLIFSIFINWDAEIVESIITNEDLHSTNLTRGQFTSLFKLNYIDGCIFDWRVIPYPPGEVSKSILSNFLPSGGESIFLIANQSLLSFEESKPKLSIISTKLVDEPPSKNIWNVYKDKSYEEIFLRFADDEPTPGKCWLLYKNEE